MSQYSNLWNKRTRTSKPATQRRRKGSVRRCSRKKLRWASPSNYISSLKNCNIIVIDRPLSEQQVTDGWNRNFASVGNDTKWVQQSGLLFSLGSDLRSRRLCEERNVTDMSTVSGCDVTTVQQHHTGSTSTPPRVASVRFARRPSLHRKFSKIYACSHVSIVRLVQSIVFVSRDSHCHSSPLYHLPGDLVSLSSVPMPSIDLNLWILSRPSAFVPMSLGFTSVLTDDIVKSFRDTKS